MRGVGKWDVKWKAKLSLQQQILLACGEIVLSKHVTIRTDLSHEYYLIFRIILGESMNDYC